MSRLGPVDNEKAYSWLGKPLFCSLPKAVIISLTVYEFEKW